MNHCQGLEGCFGKAFSRIILESTAPQVLSLISNRYNFLKCMRLDNEGARFVPTIGQKWPKFIEIGSN